MHEDRANNWPSIKNWCNKRFFSVPGMVISKVIGQGGTRELSTRDVGNRESVESELFGTQGWQIKKEEQSKSIHGCTSATVLEKLRDIGKDTQNSRDLGNETKDINSWQKDIYGGHCSVTTKAIWT